MNTPKFLFLPLAFAVLGCSTLIAATTPILGAIAKTINGTGGTSSEALTFIGVPLYHQHAHRSVLTAYGANSLSDNTAAWTTDEFANAYFVEILDGANAGVTATITDNSATQLTTAEDLSSFLSGGEAFGIRKYTTLADLFGATNSVGLQGGSSSATADEVLVPNAGTQGFDIYFYKDSGFLGGTGWRKTTDLFTEQSGLPIPPNQAVIVKRKAASDLSMILSGSVLENNAIIPIEEDANWINSAFPVDQTLSGMFGADGGSLDGGSSSADADEVLVPNGSGGFTVYFYKNSGFLGGTGWRSTTDLFTDQANTVISAPSHVVIVKRTQGGAFNLTEARAY